MLLFSVFMWATIDGKDTKSSDAYQLKEIKLAKTIGVWSDNNASGFFTVIVYRSGLEHGSEKTRVLVKQINTYKDGTADFEIIKDIMIDTPSISGSVEDMRLRIVHNKLFLGLDIMMRGMAGAVLQKSLLVDIDGNVKTIQDASYDDTIHDEIKKVFTHGM